MARRGAKLGTSVLDLDIDDSRFHSKMSGAARAAQQFTDRAGSGLMRAGKAISGVGQSMVRNVTLPILAAGGAVTKFALDFDTTLTQISALTTSSRDQVAAWGEELKRLGPALGKSPQELAEALYFVASAGFEGESAMKVMTAAAKASAAGLGDTATVAKVVGAAVNAYGEENLNAARATDILLAAVAEGTAEAPQFAASLGNVIGSAAQIGAKFEDVTAAIAAMTTVGVGAEESVTSLNQVFVTLFKPTSKAKEALEGYGLTAASLRTMIAEKGLLPTLGLLAEKFDGNAEATAEVFGNVRALRGILALTGGDAEKTAGIFDRVSDSVGALDTAFEETSESAGFKLKRSMAELQVTAIELGDDVLPIVVEILGKVADAARGLSESWGTLDKGTKDLVIQALAFLAIAGPVLIVLGKLTTAAGALLKVIAFLGGAKMAAGIKGLGLAFRSVLGPIGLLLIATEGVNQGVRALNETIGGATGAFERLGQAAGGPSTAMNAVKELAEETGRSRESIIRNLDLLIAAGHDWDTAVRMMADGFTTAFMHSAEEAQRWVPGMTQAASDAREGVADEMADLPPEVVSALEDAGIPIGAAADDTMGEVSEAAAAAREASVKAMADMLSGMVGLFDSDESVRDAWQALIDRMDDPYTEAERKADIFGTNTIENIRSAIKTGDPGLIGDTTDMVNRLLGEFALMEPGALESGNAVPPAIRTGMDAEMQALIDWVEANVTGEALSALSLDEAKAVGVAGLWSYNEGMLANQRAASSAGERSARSALTGIMTEVSWIQVGRNIVDLIANGVTERQWRAQSAMAGLAQVMKIPMPSSEPKDRSSALYGITTAWGMVDTIAAGLEPNAALRNASRALAAAMAPNLGPDIAPIRMPRLADVGAMSFAQHSDLSGVRVRSQTSGGDVHYHLHVDGKEMVVGDRDDVLDAWALERRFTDRSLSR